MRIRLAHVLVAALLPSIAAAQTTREDGIRAMLAGDYIRAAQILRPLAENAEPPDSVAQFLMAMLYDTGHGVERDLFRACGLFARAAAAPGPFLEPAVQLTRGMREEFGPGGSPFCTGQERWQDMPPRSFTLAPDHTVTITTKSIVIRDHDAERRIITGSLPGWISVPVIYTPLDVTRPVQARRHFLQWFIWMPNGSSSWTLGWSASEVVGTNLLPVAMERSVTTVDGAQPPASFDLSAVARVRVAESGEAEWLITAGPNPRSALIPWRDPR